MGSVVAHWVFVLIMYFTTQMTVESKDHQLSVIVVVTILLVNAFVLVMYFTTQIFFQS